MTTAVVAFVCGALFVIVTAVLLSARIVYPIDPANLWLQISYALARRTPPGPLLTTIEFAADADGVGVVRGAVAYDPTVCDHDAMLEGVTALANGTDVGGSHVKWKINIRETRRTR